MKPGVSTIVSRPRLNESQKPTKRAPFCEAAMSRVPAMAWGWLASTPTGWPAIRTRAVTS